MDNDNQKDGKKDKDKIFLSLSLFGELLYEIAIPVVVLTLLGRYLDKVWQHDFLFVLIGGILGIVLGVLAVYAKAEKMRQKIYGKTKEDKEEKEKKK